LTSEDTMKSIISCLRKTPGIRKIKVLSDVERHSLLQVELSAEETMIGCCGFNEGLREALSRKFVVVCSTDMDFEWPNGPYVVLKEGEVIVGFITDNVDRIKQQFDEKISVFVKDLVIFPERIQKLRGGKRSPTLFIHKGFTLPEIEKKTKAKDVFLAFCTRAGDACLKQLLKEKEDPKIGSIVIGFNI